MSSESHSEAGRQFPAIGIVILMLMVSLTQIHWTHFADEKVVEQTSSNHGALTSNHGASMVVRLHAMVRCQHMTLIQAQC